MRVIEDRQPLWPYILLSLVLHVLLVGVFSQLRSPEAVLAEKAIEVVPIFERPEASAKYRIADIAEPKIQKKPDKAEFLGMYDSSVEEETVGVDKSGKSGGAKGTKLERKAQAKAKRMPMHSGKDRIFAFDESIFEGGQSKTGDEHSKGFGSALNDFYPDFKRGAYTYLNVLRHPDVEYFVRLKRAFKIAFNPEPALREYFSYNRVTRGSVDVVLGVSVDRVGNLSEIFIFRSSGIAQYDREALRTVRVSAPFSSPPEKFVDNDGQLRMSWTFTVYL
jgi:TonB family protein